MKLIFISIVFLFIVVEGRTQVTFVDVSGKPLFCKVIINDGGSTTQKDTDKNGHIEISDICSSDDVWAEIVPYNPSYSSTEIYCPSKRKEITLYDKDQWSNLIANAGIYDQYKNNKRALSFSILAGNEVVEIYRQYNNSTLTDSVSTEVFALTAQYFGLDRSLGTKFDPSQKNVVMSDTLRSLVKSFQAQNDLPAQGILGWRTISKMAESSPYMVYAAAVAASIEMTGNEQY